MQTWGWKNLHDWACPRVTLPALWERLVGPEGGWKYVKQIHPAWVIWTQQVADTWVNEGKTSKTIQSRPAWFSHSHNLLLICKNKFCCFKPRSLGWFVIQQFSGNSWLIYPPYPDPVWYRNWVLFFFLILWVTKPNKRLNIPSMHNEGKTFNQTFNPRNVP